MANIKTTDGLMKAQTKIAQKAGSIVKSVVNKLDSTFIEPSRRVRRIKNIKMQEMQRKAESGEFNQ